MFNHQSARSLPTDDPTGDPFARGPDVNSTTARIASEADAGDGTSVIEVRTLFRGVGTDVRILPDPSRKDGRPAAARLVWGGVALAAAAVALFVVTAADVSAETRAFDRWREAGRDPRAFAWKPRSAALDVLFMLGLAGGGALAALGLARRGQRRPGFVVGVGAGVDAPVDPAYLPATDSVHPLVAVVGDGYVVNATTQMRGEIVAGGASYSLPDLVQQHGSSFTLPPEAEARLVCGETTFVVAATARPRRIAAPAAAWRWDQQGYTAAAATAVGLFLLMVFMIPPDPRSLSLGIDSAQLHWVPTTIMAPELPPPPESNKHDKDPGGTDGKRHVGPEGQAGKKTSRDHDKAYAVKGPKDATPQLSKQQAIDDIATRGMLGILKQDKGGVLASIFGADKALGNDAENFLGNLMGNQFGHAYGVGGLGVVGTGAGGGGTGEGTLGVSHLGLIGRGRGPGGELGYGYGAGGLHGRKTIKMPGLIMGQVSTRGSLDKEIVRRIIRRHINEVKYCYEQELVTKPNLGGRLMVQFTISGAGQVITSVLVDSTMHNAKVENCTVQAVRRWEFPHPEGGGLVIVTYPFVLAPAGSGAGV